MSKNKTSLAVNYIYNSLYQILLIVIPLITTPYVSRVLGAAQIGVHSYTYSIANYFMLFGMLGVNNYGNRCVAKVRDDKIKLSKTFWSIYFLQLICSAISVTLYLIYVIFGDNQHSEIAILQTFLILSGLLDITWFFFGMEEFKLSVARNAVLRLSSVVLIFVLVKNQDDLWKYTLIVSGGLFVSQAYLWVYVKKYVEWNTPSVKEIFSHLRPELILFVPAVAISLYKTMDKIMLGALSSMTQVGYYQNSERIINIPLGLITALGTVMLPRISNMIAHGNDDKSRRYLKISIGFVTFLGIAMTFGLAAISYELAPVFLGLDFSECSDLILLLSITVPFCAWANVVRTQYLIPKSMDRSYLISVFVGAIVNLIANALLIPIFDAKGAVVGTILAEFSVCLVQCVCVQRQTRIIGLIAQNLFYIPAGIIMYIVVRWIAAGHQITPIWLAVEIICGACVYILSSVILMVLFRPSCYQELLTKIKRNQRNKKTN